MAQLPSDSEISQAAEVLSRLEPGILPFEIFHQFMRLAVAAIIEVVPLRLNPTTGIAEIFLQRRPADDPIWPSQLHIPGTVLRASDGPHDFQSAFNRIWTKELGMPGACPEPHFVQNILHYSGRGMESSQIHWLMLEQSPEYGEFYAANDLPKDIVQSQLDFIPLAVQNFEQLKQTSQN